MIEVVVACVIVALFFVPIILDKLGVVKYEDMRAGGQTFTVNEKPKTPPPPPPVGQGGEAMRWRGGR